VLFFFLEFVMYFFFRICDVFGDDRFGDLEMIILFGDDLGM
jgi:hypothetical protein